MADIWVLGRLQIIRSWRVLHLEIVIGVNQIDQLKLYLSDPKFCVWTRPYRPEKNRPDLGLRPFKAYVRPSTRGKENS